MNAILDLARRTRLRGLLAAQLSNADEVWKTYRSGAPVPPLRFRNGAILRHDAGPAAVFLFFEIFANGCYRRHLTAPAAGETIVDIGANIGAFTLDCAMRFPGVRIEAYEPNPRAFDVLGENIAANRLGERVRAYREAVGRSAGTLKLWGASGGSLVATSYPKAEDAREEAMDVPMIDLQTALARAGGTAHAVKLDAEGAEVDILEGGGDAVRCVREYVAEYHEDRVPDVVARCRSVFERSAFAFKTACTRRCGPLFHARRIG